MGDLSVGGVKTPAKTALDPAEYSSYGDLRGMSYLNGSATACGSRNLVELHQQ